MTERRVQLNVRIPVGLHERIEAAASERGMTMAWFVARLLDESLDRLIPADEIRLARPASEQVEIVSDAGVERGPAGSVVHLCPEVGSGTTGCCGMVPSELPRSDRLTTSPESVTCPGSGRVLVHGDPETGWCPRCGAVCSALVCQCGPECLHPEPAR